MKTADLIARLEEESTRLSGRSIDRGCVDSGIASNLASEAATRLATLEAEADALRADNARKDELLTAAVDDYNEARAAIRAVEADMRDRAAKVADELFYSRTQTATVVYDGDVAAAIRALPLSDGGSIAAMQLAPDADARREAGQLANLAERLRSQNFEASVRHLCETIRRRVEVKRGGDLSEAVSETEAFLEALSQPGAGR
jgi:hypothetical protein